MSFKREQVNVINLNNQHIVESITLYYLSKGCFNEGFLQVTNFRTFQQMNIYIQIMT